MRKRLLAAALPFVFVCCAVPAYGQEASDVKQCVQQGQKKADCTSRQLDGEVYDPQTALMTVVEPKIEADTTSASPLGDDYDPVTGAVTFTTTDISIPGNFPIPVELRRWVPRDDYDTGGPTGWAWNIPFIKGNLLDVKDGHGDAGWDWGYHSWHQGENCSGGADSVIDNHGELIAPNAYWSGKLLHIPGATSETFLTKSDGSQVTKSNFRITGCINNPDGQQGIVVAGPDGLTYTFNQIKTYYNGKLAYKDPIVRTRLLMVTKVEDRFGNHVDYSYTNGELTGISASDGRNIVIDYVLVGNKRRPTTATAHGSTWTYGYAGSAFNDKLTAVTLPDGVSKWTYNNVHVTAFQPNGIGNYSQQFRIGGGQATLIPGCSTSGTESVATVTTPYGLTSTYTFKDLVLYRSDVEPDFYQDKYNPDYTISRAVHCTTSRALIAKSIAGPGIATANWTYAYSTNTGTYTAASGLNGFLTGPFTLPVPAVGGYPEPINSGNAVDYRATTVTGPERKSVFYINRKFQSLTENRVVAQDTLNAAGSALLERTQSIFEEGPSVGNHWYMCPCDGAYPPVNEVQLSHRIYQAESIDKRYLIGGTDTYVTNYDDFDSYGFALTTEESNSVNPGWTRTTTRTYLHDTTNGLIGLPLTETVNGVTAVQNHYNSLGQLDWTKSFGKLKATLTYDNAATVASGQRGTLKTVKDGNNNVSTMSNWKRGTPQLVQFADATSRSGVVNDNGWLTSTTDENGYTTSYTYDAMGQLASIVRPSGDSTSWTTTTRSFAPVSATEYGLSAGHFRETIITGNARKLVYYDALLRPRVTREYDHNDEAGTKRFQRFTYDLEGRTTFASYPGTTDALSTGTWTQYDALGRVTSVAQDTELSPALQVTTTQYLSGARVRTTSPLGQQTTTTFMAYGQPTTDWPVLIQAPEGVTTTIVRDKFGKPLEITRGDAP